MARPTDIPIAIVGVSALFPGSTDSSGFWRDIVSGRDLLTEVPPTHWLAEDYFDPDPSAPDKTYCRRGGFIPPVDFDPLEFGIPPNTLPAIDTSQLLSLLVARRLLDGLANPPDRERVSVILGMTSATAIMGQMVSRIQHPIWRDALRESGIPEDQAARICERIAARYVPWQESSFPGLLGNVVAGRIANRLDLHGSNCVTDAACASSLSAISQATAELALGRADLVISGGADTFNDPFMYLCFSKTPAMSRANDCRPFSDKADGTILGEGIAMFALKRLADAERDSDRIYGVIRGMGSSSDGSSKSIYAPVASGQARALRRAYEAAGYGPESVELVEAHGTGTQAGDAAEVAALIEVFGSSARADRPWCALGTVKSQIGHTKAAAGAAGLFKAVMALHHKILPPTIKVDRPNPELGLEAGPLYLNTEPRPWIRARGEPRRASVSSFGFGGSNFHVTLEEHRGSVRPERLRALTSELVLIGGASAGEVARAARKMAEGPMPAGTLGFLARAGQEEFARKPEARLAIVASSEDELRERLRKAVPWLEAGARGPMPGVFFGTGSVPGSIAFIFPGQGSQYTSMSAELCLEFEAARAVWDAASEKGGGAFARATFPIPAFTDAERERQTSALADTRLAQPAIGAASLAYLSLLRVLGVAPAMAAGHSFGELSALCAAGAISPEDLLRVAMKRGELMSEAASVPGAMSAIQADAKRVEAAIAGIPGTLVVANRNSPGQQVISGDASAVEEAERRLTAAGIRFRRLPVGTAFHSPIVARASAGFRDFLGDVPFARPGVPVYGNSDAKPFETGTVRERLAAQIASPVRFGEMIAAMHADGARVFVEVGPGAALSGLVSECLEGKPHQAIALDSGRRGLASFWEGIGRLAAAGVAMDFAALWAGHAQVSDPRARASSPRVVKLTGASYGRPYPPSGGAAAKAKPVVSPAPAPQAPAPLAARVAAPAREPAQLQALQEIQRQTAEAQIAFQNALSQAHLAYLKNVEQVLQAVQGGNVTMSAPLAAPSFAPSAAVPAPVPARVPATVSVPSPSRVPAPAPMAARPVPPPRATSVSAPTTRPDRATILAKLIAIVAEKTGYPPDSLDPTLEIESGLGIDSIKRVEIFAALRTSVPGLPEVSAKEMGRLRTFAQVADYFDAPKSAEVVPPRASFSPDDPAPQLAKSSGPLERSVPRAVTRPASGFALPGLFGASCLEIAGSAELARALETRLRAAGVQARAVEELSAGADGVIWLGGLGGKGPQDSLAIHRAAWLAAKTVAGKLSDAGGVFVAVQDTGGDFGLGGKNWERAWLGGVSALVRTAAREWPNTSFKVIDLETAGRSPEQQVEAIASELLHGGPEREVGLQAASRVSIEYVREPAPTAKLESLEGLILITGGGRGVTAACARELAGATRAKFLIVGRTPIDQPEPMELAGARDEAAIMRALREGELKDAKPVELAARAASILARRETAAAIEALRKSGHEAVYVAADIRDGEALARALSEARKKWGPVVGVIHGAGVIADRRIQDKTAEQFELVFATKVDGLRAVLEATQKDPLRFLCLFSSIASKAGNAGQVDYSMANEVLNAVASAEARRRGGSCRVLSVSWGPWDGGMVGPSLRARFQAERIPLIPLEQGARSLIHELACPLAGAQVILGASPPASPPVQPRRYDLVVGTETHPFLVDHSIQGSPVVPAMLAAEWCVRAGLAQGLAPPGIEIRDLRVLRGIRLTRGVERLALETRPIEGGGLACQLRGEGGTLHYSATLAKVTGPALREPGRESSQGSWPWPVSRLYGEVLFHGREFGAIRALETMGDHGGSALLVGADALGWRGGPWAADPALLDGALQLATLWTMRSGGRVSLPARIGTIRLLGSANGSALRCRATCTSESESRAVFEIEIRREDGTLVASLSEVELYRIPEVSGDRFEAKGA
jgi:acyl transferase domain-containing protein/NADP-dependent 3-hydroxy acid dehydrogenase YdfG